MVTLKKPIKTSMKTQLGLHLNQETVVLFLGGEPSLFFKGSGWLGLFLTLLDPFSHVPSGVAFGSFPFDL